MSLQVRFVERDDQEAAGESRGHDDEGAACRDWKVGVKTYDIPIAVREYMCSGFKTGLKMMRSASSSGPVPVVTFSARETLR